MAETTKRPEGPKFEGDHDRVVMASRLPDGTPAQTENFTYIGDKETSVAAAKEQLATQAVSAADAADRSRAEDLSSAPDPAAVERIKTHERAAKSAEAKAEAEVNARHES